MRSALLALVLVAAPLAAQSPAEPVPAGLDSTLAALYARISGPADVPRDADAIRALFHEDARLGPLRPDGTPALRTVDAYLDGLAETLRTVPLFQGKGFYEREIGRRVERFGPLAHVWSTYAGALEPGGDPFVRGVNSIQLVEADGRWVVVQILWQQESPELILPKGS